MLLGLGVGHRNLVEDMRGHSYHKPLSAMRTYLGAMDAAPYFSQRPTTPVRKVLAALGPKMLALAGEFAEGALTYFVPPEHTAYARGALGEGPTLCVEQAVLLESDPTRAREIARGHTAIYLALPNYANNLRRLGYTEADLAGAGSDRLVDAVVAWGTEDEVVARVESHLQAGADHVCVQALSVRRNVPATQWRELAPALRAVSRRPVIR
jgi:probable F420-dependent oxidoreductase